MNDQNRYRGSSSQRNQSEGRGSGWSRDDERSAPDRGNYGRSRWDYERSQSSGQPGYGRFSEDRFGEDRPFSEQDREYRGGSSGYGRSRDYQSEWSGFGAQGSSAGRDRDDERNRYGSYDSSRDRSDGSDYGWSSSRSGPSYAGSDYGSGSRSGSYGSGSYGSGSYGSGSYRPGSYTSSSGSNWRGSQGQHRYGSERPWTDSNYSTTGSYSGRGPKGYTRSDERIREDVCERLSESDEVDASEIEVQVKDRTVTLSGTVQNRRMKHIAEDLAEAVSGVDDVDNRISVTKPFLKDIADRITGNEGESHYANTGTKNGPTSSTPTTGSGLTGASASSTTSSSSAMSGAHGTNGRA